MRKVTELEKLIFENNNAEINSKDIIEFLNLKGPNHTGGYFHYTTAESFAKMLSSNKLHLSSGAEMNDLLEPKKCSPDRWKKIYIASFAFGKYENMAMWGIYGDPLNEAIRIKIPCTDLNNAIECAKETHKVYRAAFDEKNKNYHYEQLDAKFDIKIVDVIYYHEKSLEYNKNFINLKKYPNLQDSHLNADFTGYLKNRAWFYENETRIIVEFEQCLPQTPTIAIDFSSALKNLSITSSPCNSSASLKEIFKRKKISLSKFRLNIEESYYKGFLHFRKRCAACTYNESERKHHCAYLQCCYPDTKG